MLRFGLVLGNTLIESGMIQWNNESLHRMRPELDWIHTEDGACEPVSTEVAQRILRRVEARNTPILISMPRTMEASNAHA